MNILYLGYWPANDPLTTSVIIPRLQILAEMPQVSHLVLVSIERNNPVTQLDFKHEKLIHRPFSSRYRSNVYVNKASDFIRLPLHIGRLVETHKIDFIIANSPLAGILAFVQWKRAGTRYIVECFEPHAQSMIDSNVWSSRGLRYRLLKYFEQKQIETASYLATVSAHYSKWIVSNGADTRKVHTVPNTVDLVRFQFNRAYRDSTRLSLDIKADDVVAIYVGKFGGIYYDEEAFRLFAHAFAFFPNFKLIILTVHHRDEVIKKLVDVKIPTQHVIIRYAEHGEVPKYLSAADFAFSTIKPVPSRLYCCPVKNGEYWANGLPIITEDGIGDDSDIIREEDGGVLIKEIDAPEDAFRKIMVMIQAGRENVTPSISALAKKYRNPQILFHFYNRIFDN